MRQVSLPDLSRAGESVTKQLRDGYASLMAVVQKPGTSDLELGSAYGEMGRLLMAAEYREAAEQCLSECADPGARRCAVAVLSRAPLQRSRRRDEIGGVVRAGGAAPAERSAHAGVAGRCLSRSGTGGGRRAAVHEGAVAAAALGPGAVRPRADRAGQAGAFARGRLSGTGAGARSQSPGDPLSARDGLPRRWAMSNRPKRTCANAAPGEILPTRSPARAARWRCSKARSPTKCAERVRWTRANGRRPRTTSARGSSWRPPSRRSGTSWGRRSR